MPTNKNAAFRYRVLDELFSRPGRGYTIEQLVEEVNEALWEAFGREISVKKRALSGDINIMRSDPPRGFAAPIKVSKKYYTYTDKKFSIHKAPLNQADVRSIREAIGLLQQFKGLPHYQELALLLSKISGNLVNVSEKRTIIQFETNELLKGLEWLEPCYKSILHREVQRITYHPFTQEEPYEVILHPYLLKEYRNRWFLFGWNEQSGSIHNLALDRLVGMEPDGMDYYENPGFDPETYFKDIVGVTIIQGLSPVSIVFKTTVLLARYLQSKPIHSSQTVLGQGADHVLFSLKVIPNYELKSELQRYGDDLQVIGQGMEP